MASPLSLVAAIRRCFASPASPPARPGNAPTRPDNAPRCWRCNGAATFRSQVSGHWLCAACNPCWCGWCMGRVGVHGPEAVSQYRQEAEAAFAVVTGDRPS